MKNVLRFFGIVALMTAIGFSFIACDTDGNNSGEDSSYSLNGVWESSGGMQITVSGSTGVWNAMGTLTAWGQSAFNQGMIKIGDQTWRNLTSTGNLTWSGQLLLINYNTSTNVATGTEWYSCTITMSTNGQTITITNTGTSGVTTYTRSNYSLNGVWESSSGDQITVSGSTGVWSAKGTLTAWGQSAFDQGMIKIGDQEWRNLTSAGSLKWSGELLLINYNTSTNVATGTSWYSCTITMSTNGQTISITNTGTGGKTTYTRKQ